MKESEAAKLVGKLVAALPSATVRDGTVAVYVEMLLDLEYEAAERAVNSVIASHRYSTLPTIAEIRQSVAADEVGAIPADEAFEIMMRGIGKFGGVYGVPAYENPLIQRAVELIGWKTICNWPVETQGVLRAQFKSAYEGQRIQAESRTNLVPLMAAVVDRRRIT